MVSWRGTLPKSAAGNSVYPKTLHKKRKENVGRIHALNVGGRT